ncbi:TerB family tellurite resistance protein [Pedobacter gandavensis]|uniref:TerB family tellurite resistance protein n=1 Tax=Pedobacter gandavensis TaxID=2679963 RepID=UPI00292F185E|nr:TerB family tellurite resistance protein [Pedobacter gandavensis]
MKRIFLFLLFLFSINQSFGQSQEAQQLLLNVEKLSQLKGILSSMKKGYVVVSKGYNSVKNIAQGNFSLHEVFLDAMMLVSPEVKKYRRIGDIITAQSDIVSEYKSAFKWFNSGGNFTLSELDYLSKVYSQLFNQSLDNLDQLTMVITANKLRMTDDERLQAIDRIFADSQDKLMFLRSFNLKTNMLNIQRQKEKVDVAGTKQLYNLN